MQTDIDDLPIEQNAKANRFEIRFGDDVARLEYVLNRPMYDPSSDDVPESVIRLVESTYASDGMIWSSPLYQGSISGAFKNSLDWLILLGQRKPAYLMDKLTPGRRSNSRKWWACVPCAKIPNCGEIMPANGSVRSLSSSDNAGKSSGSLLTAVASILPKAPGTWSDLNVARWSGVSHAEIRE